MAEDPSESGVTFEEAIAKTGGYGPYQRNMLVKMSPVGIAFVFGSTTMAYVMPAVICEFHISKYHQGILYSAIYFGMIPFGAVWGIAADIFGRRTILIITTTITGFFELLSAFSTNYWMLFLCKVFSGCALCGLHLTYYIYLSEFVDAKFKDAMTIRTGSFAAFGYFLQPVIAVFLIPLKFKYVIIDDYLYINSWKAYVLLCSLVPVLGIFVGLFFIAETPKYLLIQKRNDESLEILKDIYAKNLNKPRDSFPVKRVILEADESKRQETQEHPDANAFARAVNYAKPLFQYPHLIPALMSFVAQFITMGAYSTIRQHLPTLFVIALGFSNKVDNGNLTARFTDVESVPFCVIFENEQGLFSSDGECKQEDIHLDPRIFMSSSVVGFVIFVAFFVVRYFVQVFGKVSVFLTIHIIGAMAISYFPFSNALFAVIMMTIYSMGMQNCLIIALGLMIGRVPTTLRGLAVSLIMVVGRLGVIFGNQVLPIFTNISCYAAFWSIAFINLLSIPVMYVYSRQPNPYEDAALKSADKTD